MSDARSCARDVEPGATPLIAVGTVTAMYRYPVKSMLGEPLVSVVVNRTGLSEDRTHAELDETGAIGSAKHPRRNVLRLRPGPPVVTTSSLTTVLEPGAVRLGDAVTREDDSRPGRPSWRGCGVTRPSGRWRARRSAISSSGRRRDRGSGGERP
ncbi:MOSC N-terminal beta barrel domain-containing protein [Streptomyces massasporeus]|uniref:MOSC N-terminal beta barrel domain-containing protein n=1 Tax=Streptomyces massasporeus TaxID=67324 RepID=UPI00380D5A5E